MKLTILLFSIITLFVSPTVHAEPWDLLSDTERKTLDLILVQWETWIPERKEMGTAPMISFDELYEGLSEEEISFLERVRNIDPKKDFGFQGSYLGGTSDGIAFRKLDDQWMNKKEGREKIGPQYLPEPIYEVYQTMMKAMKRDLGKILLVESGFRSQAYQLYTFLYYTPKHRYSLVETGRYVAIPGYSEHGAPQVQAIDFINEEGINGEDNPEEFEELPEYAWLQKNAQTFGFELSYPRNQPGITFEPWHWRYTGES